MSLAKPQKAKVSHREPMRWLFTAYCANGDRIVQTQDDKSAEEPNRSAFYDVQQRDDIIGFELKHENGSESIYMDLVGGAFLINGTPLQLHNQFFEPKKYKLEPVYFTETNIQQTISVKTGEELAIKHFANRYFIGWQTKVHGKNKQVTLAVG